MTHHMPHDSVDSNLHAEKDAKKFLARKGGKNLPEIRAKVNFFNQRVC